MVHAKILVVDQDTGAYEALKPGLSRHGYEIHTTTTSTSALALAGAHAYQAAFVSSALFDDQALLDGLRAEIPDLPVILALSPEHVDCVPPQILAVAANAVGKPLALGPVCLTLDRTMELVALRAQVRQQRQTWYVAQILPPGTAAPPGMEAHAIGPLIEALTRQLRHLMPSLEALGRCSLHRAMLSYVEKLLLTIILTECRGNQAKSAEILGINRNTLRKKIHDLGLSLPRGNG
jgi:DNA-binding NtrC family response regulator